MFLLFSLFLLSDKNNKLSASSNKEERAKPELFEELFENDFEENEEELTIISSQNTTTTIEPSTPTATATTEIEPLNTTTSETTESSTATTEINQTRTFSETNNQIVNADIDMTLGFCIASIIVIVAIIIYWFCCRKDKDKEEIEYTKAILGDDSFEFSQLETI